MGIVFRFWFGLVFLACRDPMWPCLWSVTVKWFHVCFFQILQGYHKHRTQFYLNFLAWRFSYEFRLQNCCDTGIGILISGCSVSSALLSILSETSSLEVLLRQWVDLFCSPHHFLVWFQPLENSAGFMRGTSPLTWCLVCLRSLLLFVHGHRSTDG